MVVYDLGKVTDWLIAIGTIGAVIVSLYFSYNSSRKKAKVILGYENTPIREQLFFRIVNVGKIPIEVSTSKLEIHKPWWSKKEALTLEFHNRKPEVLEQSKSKTVYLDNYSVDKKIEDMGILPNKKIRLKFTFRDTEGFRYSKVFTYISKEPIRLEERVMLTKKN